MIKYLSVFFIFFLLSSCSLDNKTGIWTKNQKIKKENKTEVKEVEKNITEISKSVENLKSELNPNFEINLITKPIKNSFINKNDNNNGRINYNGKLKSISKYKFSKIDNFYKFEPEIIFDTNNIIFFDNKGTILNFNNSSKLIWKRNFYNKSEKKLKPILFMAKEKKTLIVADNLARYYGVDTETGALLWYKTNTAAFNSQIKIYKDRFFVVDLDNVIRCYSIKDGSEIWNYQTEKAFIKSQKKMSIIVVKNRVFFNNSIGDITALDTRNGDLIWQTPTQSSTIYGDVFKLKTSDLVANNGSIFFSNNQNEFYSLNIKNGLVNWKQKINSDLRSTIIDNIIFTITLEGYLVVTNSESGKILRITDLFHSFDKFYFLKKKGKKVNVRSSRKPEGFIVGTNNIYLTTNNGRLIVVSTKTGKIASVLKIDKERISRPFILNDNLYIIKNDSIIKLN